MKKICLLFILFSLLGFSQTKKSYVLPSLNSISIDTTFKIKPIPFNLNKSYTFTSYNSNLNLQFNYLKSDKSTLINSISHSFTTNALTRNKIDSYNPSGADSFGGAIVTGFLNLIFND